jgi:hypothetical protein
MILLHRRVRAAVQREYGTPAEPLAVVALSGGAAVIRSSLQAMFDTLERPASAHFGQGGRGPE